MYTIFVHTLLETFIKLLNILLQFSFHCSKFSTPKLVDLLSYWEFSLVPRIVLDCGLNFNNRAVRSLWIVLAMQNVLIRRFNNVKCLIDLYAEQFKELFKCIFKKFPPMFRKYSMGLFHYNYNLMAIVNLIIKYISFIIKIV